MIEGAALTVGVVEANLDNGVVAAFPNNFNWFELAGMMVIISGDGDRGGNFLNHTIRYIPKEKAKSMGSRLQKTTIAYNKIATYYAKVSESRINTDQINKFLSYIDPGGYILDVGCAAGRDSAYMIKNGYQVLGIDVSKELLKQARIYHPEVETKLMDMRKINLPDSLFDGVWAQASLMHLRRNEVEEVIKALNHILKVGGILHIQVKKGVGQAWVKEERSAGLERFYTYFKEGEMENILINTNFKILSSKIYNGKKVDAIARNIDWITINARKGKI